MNAHDHYRFDAEELTSMQNIEIKLSDIQRKIICTITKNSFLGCIGLAFTIIANGMVVIEWLLKIEPGT